MIIEVKSTAIDLFLLKLYGERNTGLQAIAAPSCKQPNNLSQLQNVNLKVNRDKLALSNHPWKCKKGKRLTIPLTFRSDS